MNQKRIFLESGTNEMELLTVCVGEQVFGMNVAKVQSIEKFDPNLVTSLPAAPREILGTLLYRNKTIPLIDLSTVLEKPPETDASQSIVVVTEFNGKVNGFKVSRVRDIRRMSWSQFVPLNEMLKKYSCVTGSVNIDGTEVMVLDLEHILSTLFPDQMLEKASESVIEKQKSLSRDQIKILFAEDSLIIRRGVANVLEKAGYMDIEQFEDGQSALEHIQNQDLATISKSEKTVLITDIEMPRMDGLTLCRNIKSDQKLSALPVIIFSSLINQQMIQRCEKVGADGYVTKPQTNRLLEILDDLCFGS